MHRGAVKINLPSLDTLPPPPPSSLTKAFIQDRVDSVVKFPNETRSSHVYTDRNALEVYFYDDRKSNRPLDASRSQFICAYA